MSKSLPKPKKYRHQELMDEFNDLMIRAKIHLLAKEDGLINLDQAKKFKKPTSEELNRTTARIIQILRQDKEDFVIKNKS